MRQSTGAAPQRHRRARHEPGLQREGVTMRKTAPAIIGLFGLFVALASVVRDGGAARTAEAMSAAPAAESQQKGAQERGGQEEFGPYEPVENWPQGLPDGPDGVKHAGWTWGSVGGV